MSARFWRGSRILPFQEFPVSFSRSLSCSRRSRSTETLTEMPLVQATYYSSWKKSWIYLCRGVSFPVFKASLPGSIFIRPFKFLQRIKYLKKIFQLKGQNHVVGMSEKCKQYFGHTRLNTSFNNSHSDLNLNKTNFSRLREMKRSWEILKEMPRELREAQTSQNPACTIRYSTGWYVWIL